MLKSITDLFSKMERPIGVVIGEESKRIKKEFEKRIEKEKAIFIEHIVPDIVDFIENCDISSPVADYELCINSGSLTISFKHSNFSLSSIFSRLEIENDEINGRIFNNSYSDLLNSEKRLKYSDYLVKKHPYFNEMVPADLDTTIAALGHYFEDLVPLESKKTFDKRVLDHMKSIVNSSEYREKAITMAVNSMSTSFERACYNLSPEESNTVLELFNISTVQKS